MVENKERILESVMINNGLSEMAANAVELVVDEKSGIAYAVYLSSESSIGESDELVNIAKFNIMQPTNARWATVFDKRKDFSGARLSECNVIDLDEQTLRVFAVNLDNLQYYFKDVNKKTLTAGEMKEVKFKPSCDAAAVSFNKDNINSCISSLGGHLFSYLQFTTAILKHENSHYTTVCGGNEIKNFLFMKSEDGGAVWTFLSLVKHSVNYEAMLARHNGKFFVMCRSGKTEPSDEKQTNLVYSEDGINWKSSTLALETSDTRPYLFNYQGELWLAYSSPLPKTFSTVRPWRCNIHVGRIKSDECGESFEEVIYKESKFGIVYYALRDWYGKLIMLYSTGELFPTEGLMGGWSQGKDCLKYTILKNQDPILRFKEK